MAPGKTLDFAIALPKEINLALQVLRDKGFKAYVVGGAIRDALMGKSPHDFDVASSALPAQVMRLFPGYNIVKSGIKHGTVRVIIHKYPVEITTFRSEGPYKDFRHPENVTFVSSAFEDSQRRDFTINAFYYLDGQISDFHDGLKDLKDGIIRTVGKPQDRFKEDALRIIRGLRFATELGFIVEPETQKAMAVCAHELLQISEERIESELLKTASYNTFLKTVKDNRIVFDQIIGNLEEIADEHLDLVTVNDPYVNLAILFMLLKYLPGQAEQKLRELKFSNDNSKAIVSLMAIDNTYTLKSLTANEKNLRKFLLDTYPLNPETCLDYLFVRDRENKRNFSAYDALKKVIDDDVPVAPKDLMVTGNDLKRLGFKQGPDFKKVLQELLLMVNQKEVATDRKSQLAWLKNKAKNSKK